MRSLLPLLILSAACGRDLPVEPPAPPAPPPYQRVRLTAVTSDTRQGFRFRDRAIVTFNAPPGLEAFDPDGKQLGGSAAHVDLEFAAGRYFGLRAGHDTLCVTSGRVTSLDEIDGSTCGAWSFWQPFGLTGDNAAGTGLLVRTLDGATFKLLVVESGTEPRSLTNFAVLDYAVEGAAADGGELLACSDEGGPCVEHGDCCNARHSCIMGACLY
ncbi:MAG: hypothetical protein QM723_17925 [Myxococcaceae bacterium]